MSAERRRGPRRLYQVAVSSGRRDLPRGLKAFGQHWEERELDFEAARDELLDLVARLPELADGAVELADLWLAEHRLTAGQRDALIAALGETATADDTAGEADENTSEQPTLPETGEAGAGEPPAAPPAPPELEEAGREKPEGAGPAADRAGTVVLAVAVAGVLVLGAWAYHLSSAPEAERATQPVIVGPEGDRDRPPAVETPPEEAAEGPPGPPVQTASVPETAPEPGPPEDTAVEREDGTAESAPEGAVSFEESRITVGEGAGAIAVRLQRAGGGEARETALGIQGVTASEGRDYIDPDSPTVRWAPGSVGETLFVPLIDDSVREADETLRITIEAAGGPAVSPTTLTVRIVDDDGG